MYLLPALRWGRALLSCLELLCIAAARDSGSRGPPLLLEAQVWEDSRPGSRVAGFELCGRGLRAAGAGLRCELSGEAHSDFRLSPSHAACGSTVRTAAPLDREVRSTYLLRLNCSWRNGVSSGARGGVPAALVRVRVRDVNDNRPVFSPGLALRLEVDELTAVGSELARVTATDNDEGSNAAIVYSLSPPVPQLFVVPGTGQILVVDSLLGALPLWLSVYARDKGANSRLSEPLTVLLQQELAPGLRRDTRSPSQEMVHSVTVPEGDKLGNVIYTIPDWKFERRWFEVIAPDDAPVQIERDSGRVYLSKRLRGTATVQITVKVSNQKGEDWYISHLTINVLRECLPEWTMQPFPYLTVVSSDAPKGTPVFQISARGDSDHSTAGMEYFLTEGGEERFEVDKHSGIIRTTGLTLLRHNEYVLTVLAVNKQGNKGPPATIFVLVGSRPPQFTNVSYSIFVSENTPAGQPLIIVEAISFQRKPLSYSLLINPSSLFRINQDNGELSLIHSIDFESEHHLYHLLVRVLETGTGLSSVTEVVIHITDENDCTPEFVQSIYSRDNVPENIPIGTSLLQVLAQDCDTGLNAEISYFSQGAEFTITPQGIISPKQQLDYERPNHMYEFVVAAVDKGHLARTGTASVRIRMTNINDEVPVFSQSIYKTFLSEDAGPNSLVATVHAKDPDGDSVIYTITGGNEDNNFELDNQKGIIKLRRSPLPKLQGPQYVLNVTATDDNTSGGSTSLSSIAQVIVGINDVNNNKPVFSECIKYSEDACVLENQPPGTFVLQVRAHDADLGVNGQVKYGLMIRDGVTPGFHINPDTGSITTTQSFDRENQREYTVSVTATDQAQEPLIGICQMIILIADENDNDPKFENSRYQYYLREDTPVGTSFLRAAAHDDDHGTNAVITYSISRQQPEYFQISPSTGWIYVNHPISQIAHISRQIIATDGGNRSSSVELTVTITNIHNQPPQWEQEEYQITIPENTTRDLRIVTIKATSPLGDPRVTYNLEEGQVPETNMPIRFYLKPNRADGSASILVAEPLDFEITKFFILRVRAQNVAAVPLASFTTIFVNVTDVNDNVPFFTSSIYEATVPEGAAVGLSVVQVSATDLDSGRHGKINYAIVKDVSGDYKYFSIDFETGLIFTQTSFDREVKGSYLIEVQSQDNSESARPGMHGQPNTDTAYVRIFVSDVNDNAPAFPQETYTINVDEDKDIGFVVITVSANDGDEGANAKLRYQITSGNVKGMFDVEPEVGTIFIAQRLNYEQEQHYELRLVASDGKWENQTLVIINVINKNDEAPIFTQNEYHDKIMEELVDLPVLVLQVSATDPDQGADPSALRYSLHGQGANSEFTIDELNGKIYARKKLDREERSIWRFLVLATDENGEGLTGFSDVIVEVLDVNDNLPLFLCAFDGCFIGYVSENSPADTSIMEMIATDLDDPKTGKNAVLTYRIIQNVRNEINLNLFSINSSTGTVYTVLGSLDREKVNKYLIVIEARDGGGLTGTGTATILVTDVNDHAPVFTQDLFRAKVSENTEIHTNILVVSASDMDEGENALMTFSIMDGDEDHKFFIETNQVKKFGTIKLKKRLDYEKSHERRFNLTIKAEDVDFYSLATCIIDVEDYNDHTPIFFPQLYEADPLLEDVFIGTRVVQVTAVDLDSAQNGKFTYNITRDSDPHGQFSVDSNGWVTIARALDRELMPQHHLVVLATDLGSPALTGSAGVVLTVLDVNDNGPEFDVLYTPIVWENTAAPQAIQFNQTSTLMYAKDKDSPVNGAPFSFTLLTQDSHSSDFALKDFGNGSAGLTALRMFDREDQKILYLPLIITDSGFPPMSSTNTLTITIGDVNDHPHSAGFMEFLVYNYNGLLGATELGKVQAPDLDDWDDKRYRFEGTPPKNFDLNENSGFLSIIEGTPSGVYNFQVKVADGTWPDVISTIKVVVKELEEDAIYHAGSLRLTDTTAKEFISQSAAAESKYTKLRRVLSEILSAQLDNIHIFSVTDVNDQVREVDIWYAAQGSPFYKAEKMNGNVAASKTRLEFILNVSVSQIAVDACVNANCGTAPGCTSSTTFSPIPTLLNAGNFSLVSITTSTTAQCVCEAREKKRLSCSSYPINPCLNGGTCVDTDFGFRCECIPMFDGPECQQTKYTFKSHGYAWFPPIKPCFKSLISLEFLTETANGLILYDGPLSQVHSGELEDFIALELRNGIPSLNISHGSGSLHLQLPSGIFVADRHWHRLDVISDGKRVKMILDHCAGAAVNEKEGIGKGLSEMDRNVCEISGETPGEARFLNILQPLQLGGIKESLSNRNDQLSFPGFIGCIRSLIVDSKVYDLANPAEFRNSAPGCAVTDGVCHSAGTFSCGIHGKCLGEWGSFSCDCKPGYTGYKCDKALPEWSFEKDSLIQYQQKGALSTRRTQVQLMLRTRHPNCSLFSLASKDTSEYITLEIIGGYFGICVNLGDGEHSLKLQTMRVDNGQWSLLNMDRHDNEFTLRLNDGGGVHQVTASLGTHREIIINPASLVLGKSLLEHPPNDFQGCMRDVRLNGHLLPMDGTNTMLTATLERQSITVGCHSVACSSRPCSIPFYCVDLWRKHECRCPIGQVTVISNGTGLEHCAMSPCGAWTCRNGGTCIAQTLDTFICHCKEGYKGQQCEISMVTSGIPTVLNINFILAVSSCLLLLLVLVIGFSIWGLCGKTKFQKGGVYHIPVEHESWEDVRENILNYDEEGGGEEDQVCKNGYDISELKKPLRASLSQSSSIMTAPLVKTSPESREEKPLNLKTHSNMIFSETIQSNTPDFKNYVARIIWDADNDLRAIPEDTVHVYCFEGRGSLAGSLSSMDTSNVDEDLNYDYLRDWGSKFDKLKEFCSQKQSNGV
ncbi:neural-cadherin isoform X1 [Stegostoma tigrinum]|uniref:neural-cadherin isoform X1 n=1 Tax=Stegostoma tigrinum TaxID=3053191 RepID=UPI002870409A|nr:neural-cadherin isoform X1 [Stegostoma tigrinum]